MPTPSGVCASPTIRNPTSDPLADPLATTAGSGFVSEAVAGSRIVAPRGTRLTRRTFFVSVMRSRYSPGSTTISPPGCARSSAAAIDSPGATIWVCRLSDATTARAADSATAHSPPDRRRNPSSRASNTTVTMIHRRRSRTPRRLRGAVDSDCETTARRIGRLSTYTTVTLSLPPAAFAASIKRADDGVWIAGMLVDHMRRMDVDSTRSLRPSLHSSSASSGSNGISWSSTNSGIVRCVRLRPDVAIHLVAARVAHRSRLGDLARVLAFADR